MIKTIRAHEIMNRHDLKIDRGNNRIRIFRNVSPSSWKRFVRISNRAAFQKKYKTFDVLMSDRF